MKKIISYLFKAAPTVIGLMAAYFFLYILFALGQAHYGIHPLWGISYCLFGSAGSFESIIAREVSAGSNILAIVLLTITTQLRYCVYGLSVRDLYEGLHPLLRLYGYLGLTDEVFNQAVARDIASIPLGFTRAQYCLSVTALLHLSGLCGQLVGIVIGSVLPPLLLSAAECAITVLFVLGLISNLLNRKNRSNAILGILVTLACWVAVRWLPWNINFGTIALVVIIVVLILKRFWSSSEAGSERG